MVIYHGGLLNDTKWDCVLGKKGKKPTYHCHLGYLYTPPMLDLEVLVSPIKVDGKGLISLK